MTSSVSGYQTYEPRLEETVKAFKMIAEWREQMAYGKIIAQDYPASKQFHDQWEEKVYGNDKYGHILLCFRYTGIKTSEIGEYSEDELEQLVSATPHPCTLSVTHRVQAIYVCIFVYNLISWWVCSSPICASYLSVLSFTECRRVWTI